MEHRLETVEDDLKEINKALYQLIEAQSNTNRNVDVISTDFKAYLATHIEKTTATSGMCDLVFSRLKSLEEFEKESKQQKAWFFRTVGMIIIGSFMALILKGGI